MATHSVLTISASATPSLIEVHKLRHNDLRNNKILLNQLLIRPINVHFYTCRIRYINKSSLCLPTLKMIKLIKGYNYH